MKRILLLIMLFFVWSSQAQEGGSNCPIVENPDQNFCQSEGTGNDHYRPAVMHLQATANGEDVVWYDTNSSSEPLSPDELLVNGEDYFAGTASGTCSERAMVVVTLTDSPNAGGTTHYDVSVTAGPFDLLAVYESSILGPPEAGGTVTPPLASGTTIFDPAVDNSGQYRYEVASTTSCPDDFSYIYITVVPENPNNDDPSNDDPAGSENCPIVNSPEQDFCESQGTGNDFYRPAVAHLEATANGDEVVWFDTATSEEPLSFDEILVNGEDYYAGAASGTCSERAMVMVTLNDSPNAGSTTFHEVSVTAGPFDLLDVYEPSILGPPEAGGIVTPPLASGTTIFDPAVDSSGQYRYDVASNSSCPDDFSYINITVIPEDPNNDSPSGDDPAGEEHCPIVESTEQVFCESQGTGNDFYRPSVAHLEATANGDEIAWFDTPTSETPLSFDEILINGEDYYAGNISGTCTARVGVVATVNTSPNAGSTTLVTFCSESGPVDLLNYLNPSILGEADRNGEIVPPLASGTTIFDPSVDAAGDYEYHVSSPNSFCRDDYAVIYVSVSEFASAGVDTEITLDASADPVDLFAELGATPGADASWSPALESGTGIFDPGVDAPGTYTLTVFNEEGCDDDTAIITVNVNEQSEQEQNCPIVEFTTQTFCESQGEGNNFYRPTVGHLTATANGDSVRWFDTELAGEPLPADEILVDGEDYFAGNASGTCIERQRVVVTLEDSPNAGGTTEYTVNSTDAPFDLLDIYEESILGPPDAGGAMNPLLASGTTIFDPAVDTTGTYTYTVESISDCPDDRSFITINVIEVEESAASDAEASAKVSMYPNPSKGDLNISVSDGVNPISVRIIDLNGNTIKRMELNSEAELQNLDISSLRPSLYFAEIMTDQGKVVKRIIKN